MYNQKTYILILYTYIYVQRSKQKTTCIRQTSYIYIRLVSNTHSTSSDQCLTYTVLVQTRVQHTQYYFRLVSNIHSTSSDQCPTYTVLVQTRVQHTHYQFRLVSNIHSTSSDSCPTDRVLVQTCVQHNTTSSDSCPTYTVLVQTRVQHTQYQFRLVSNIHSTSSHRSTTCRG